MTDLVLLGTGTPNAEPERSGSSVAVVTGDTALLVDAGPGVVRRAAEAARAGIAALAPRRLDRVFLTHLHSDHTAGLPDLMLTPWVLGRERPLEVFGPRGTEALIEHLLLAYGSDIRERRGGIEPINETGWRAVGHDVDAGTVHRDADVEIEAFSVRHGAWPAFGYRVTSAARSIVISGDTAPSEALVDRATRCDLLAHEVYSAARFETLSPEWKRYHAAMHTSSHELAEIAARARPKLLVLYHQLLWGATEEELLAEVAGSYDGAIAFGRDLDVR